MSAEPIDIHPHTSPRLRYTGGLHATPKSPRERPAWLSIVTTTEERFAELADELRWQALFNDPRSLSLLEHMAAEALAEDDAGLTLNLDELL